MSEPSVFQFLFRLVSDVRRISPQQFLRRLVTGLANHYGAATCSIYLDEPDNRLASADPSRDLEKLAEAQQQSIRDIERDLVVKAFASGDYVSGVDVEAELPPEWDVFAFPLQMGRLSKAVVVLFLDARSKPLGEADIEALRALGDVLGVAQEKLA